MVGGAQCAAVAGAGPPIEGGVAVQCFAPPAGGGDADAVALAQDGGHVGHHDDGFHALLAMADEGEDVVFRVPALIHRKPSGTQSR